LSTNKKNVEVLDSELIEKEEIVYRKNSKKPFTGTSVFYWDDGSLGHRCSYKDGLLHGPYENYWESDRIEMKGNYIRGKRVGRWERYHKNGNLYYVTNFTDDLIREKGINIYGRSTYEDSQLHGVCESYYENGQLERRSHYKMDENGFSEKRVGHWVSYQENGLLYKREYYENDKLEGVSEKLHLNGQLDERINYEGGEKEGHYERYFEDYTVDSTTPNGKKFLGKVSTKGVYHGSYHPFDQSLNLEPKLGQLIDGEVKYFFHNGYLGYKGVFVKGHKEGEHITYFYSEEKQGEIFLIERYKKGKLHGVSEKYGYSYEVKSLLGCKTRYKNGKLHGDKDYFDYEGNLFKTKTYKDGELIE